MDAVLLAVVVDGFGSNVLEYSRSLHVYRALSMNAEELCRAREVLWSRM